MISDFTNLNPSLVKRKAKRTLYSCSANEQHRLTLNQARSSGWMCSHCGAELAERNNQVQRLEKMALELGYTLEKT